MGKYNDSTVILALFGLGYLLYSYRGIKKGVKKHYLEPFRRLKAGTSKHYSPYSQRYFRKGLLRRALYG